MAGGRGRSAAGFRTATLIAALVVSALAPASASSQVVSGRVVEDASGHAVLGAQVVLVDGAGEERGSVLTGAGGGFRLQAPGPGRYRLRTDRIGYRSTWSDALTLAAEEAAVVEIRVTTEAISLGTIAVETRLRCRIRTESGRAVTVVWEEARKALSTARLTAARPLRYAVTRYTRRLDPEGLRVLDERRTGRTAFHAVSPFASRPATQLASEGYVVPGPGTDLLYFGPDADVLLSSTFLDQHCFRLTEDVDRPGRIGLAFEPVLDRLLPDIRGVLWLDRVTAELRHLEYSYTRLPWRGIPPDRFGGRVDFERLGTGDLIVRRWRIRMPVVAERQRPSLLSGSRGTVRYVAEVLEDGGEVEEVRSESGEVLSRASGAVVAGTVSDGSGAPLPGARVWLEGTGMEARTGAGGVYRIGGVPEGVYTLRFSHPAVAALGNVLPGREVRIAEKAGSRRADLSIPSPGDLAAALCPEEPDSAAIYGVVTDPRTGEPVAGGVVVVTWSGMYTVDRTTAVQPLMSSVGSRDNAARPYTTDVAITESWEALRTTAGPGGSYHICGLPSDQLLLARAWATQADVGRGGGTLTVKEMAGQPLRWVELRAPSGSAVRANLAVLPRP